MTTNAPYLILSQLAADYRRRRMVDTADLVDREHESLAEFFGPLESFRAPPRLPWLDDYVRRLEQYRARAEIGNQYGAVDRTTQLVCMITMSLLAKCVREDEHLDPRTAESLMGAVRRSIEASMQRIENSAAAEGQLAHLEARIAMQYQQRQFSRQQEQQQAAGELVRAAARVQALKAEAT
jgi:hypothetical protein